MIKRLKVRWIEIHEEYIEGDPNDDDILDKCNIGIMEPTYKCCSFQNLEVLGDVEPDEMYEAKKRMEG